ncbi:hypothetical protein SEVIR_5G363500v4 [Setaria viridis]|uniref:Uncharacterized protein n=2 Tax=Setaria TaxID=4554 RepID=K3XNP9_SETIT|nr:uncharacterized protein LOC101758274 isoform X2 [Setaria italica]XP_034592888.1 uncharacterized protein LOC117854756 isoform X2 [Setaria viridis]RCV27853.1 hypothetical protein SETIT_5G358400v2 [Setaria italica]TKW17398.1 hypothetical protein SEVIR_5G363500v2 [Setaria viridis]
MAMEYTSKKKALLVLFMFSCLLVPMASSAAPLSRSLSLTNNRVPEPAVVEVPLQGEERNLGEVAARMDIEVNDYPGSGANNRHEPRSPGRA